jgi:hypothetical protein
MDHARTVGIDRFFDLHKKPQNSTSYDHFFYDSVAPYTLCLNETSNYINYEEKDDTVEGENSIFDKKTQ